jgi:hypothetical protein
MGDVMDKSFNDQELSDIMKEIEALEEEFSAEEDTDKVEASAMMEELAEMEEEKSIPATNKNDSVLAFERQPSPETTPATITATTTATAKTTSNTSMSFKVQGELNLELQFDIGGKAVTLEVSEAGMNIKMDGGVSFFVPVSNAQSQKKAV